MVNHLKWRRLVKGLAAGIGFILLTWGVSPVSGQERPEFVVSEGVAAIIGGNPAAARDKAIDDALRKAVEQAVGTLVSSDTLTERYRVIHDKVIARTAGYVRSYKVLSEKTEESLYRVRIQAEVDRADLTNDLRALGLLQVLAEKPKVMVIIEEKVAGIFGTDAWEKIGQAEATLNERLIAAGFTVVDSQSVRANITRDKALQILQGDDEAAAAAGLQYGAQVVITGKAMSKNSGRRILDTSMQSLQAVIQARAVRADDATLISSQSADGSHAHIDEMRGGVIAIKNATQRLADAMIRDIAGSWRTEAYDRSRQVTVVISGLVSYRHLSAVKQFLEKEMQGVRSVHQRSFLSGTAELMIDYGGKSSHMADELANRTFTGFRLEPFNVTPNRVDLKVILDAS